MKNLLKILIFASFFCLILAGLSIAGNKNSDQNHQKSCSLITSEIRKIEADLDKNMKKYWDLTARIVELQYKMIHDIKSNKKLTRKYEKLVNKRQKINRKIELLCVKSCALKAELSSIRLSLKH